ncbi:MAG: sialidase family protein [Parachlamydiales bacterium]|jgi:hypothetical protein
MKKILIVFFYALSNFGFSINFLDVSSTETELGNAEIVMNNSGKSFVVWVNNQRSNKTHKIQYAASSDFGKTWTEPKLLKSVHDACNVEPPKVIINNSGDIMCLWNEPICCKINYIKSAISCDFGKTWNFHEISDNEYLYHAALTNIDNTVLLVLVKKINDPDDEYNYLIEIRRSLDFGSSWLSSKYFKTRHNPRPEIKLRKSGKTLLTWNDEYYNAEYYKYETGDYDQHVIGYSSSDNFGEDWTDPNEILTDSEPTEIQNILNDEGNKIIMWKEQQKDFNNWWSSSLFYSILSDNEKSFGTMILDKASPGLEYYNLVSSFESSPSLFAVWESDTGGGSDNFGLIKVSVSRNFGKTWTSPKIISNKFTDCRKPILFSDSQGHVLISWNTYDNKDKSYIIQCIYSSNSGNNWSKIINLSKKDQLFKDQKIALNEKGKIIVLYKQLENNRYGYQIIISDDFGKSWK